MEGQKAIQLTCDENMGYYNKDGDEDINFIREETPFLSPVGENFEDIGHEMERKSRNFSKEVCNAVSHLNEEDVHLYIKIIKVISWSSIVISVFLGLASIGVSYQCDSPAAFVYAFDCIIDIASSAIVIWRFSSYHGKLTEEESEKITLISLGTLFIISCIAILVKSIPSLLIGLSIQSSKKLDDFESEHIKEINTCEGKWALAIAYLSLSIFAIISTGLMYIGFQLRRKSVKSDALIAIVSVVTAVSWIVSMEMMTTFPTLWYFEDVIGVLAAAFCFCYGFWLISELVALFQGSATNDRPSL